MNNPTDVNIAERRKNRALLMAEAYRAANGGRAIRVPLLDIAQKLGIAEDEANDIYDYYQGKDFFEHASGQWVGLSHIGIINIESSILESKSPPDLLLSVQKKRELRFLLLRRLFEKAGGSSQEIVNFNDVAKDEGVSEDDTSDFLYYLRDESLITAETVGYGVSITDYGIDEVEEWMEAQANGEQTIQPAEQFKNTHADNVTSSPKLKVFLCHSSRNKPAVRELYARLSADGIEPWLDEEDLLAGQDWELEIKKAVRNSDAIIVCLSEGAMTNKGYVHKEITFVMDEAARQPEGHIFIIPILLERFEIPEKFSRIHYLNYYDNPDDAYRRLLRSLKARAEEVERRGTPTRSTQTVVEPTQQIELSKEQELEAAAKISEWLKTREIWKGDWVDFKDIADATGVEVWIIKECIGYAAMLAFLKVQEKTHNSVLLSGHWGGLS